MVFMEGPWKILHPGSTLMGDNAEVTRGAAWRQIEIYEGGAVYYSF